MGKNQTKRPLIIFGGSFDPPHYGHLALAENAKRHFGIEVSFVVNGDPPHRQALIAPWEHRLAMCQLLIENKTGMTVCKIETPAKKRYTINTLEAFQKTHYPLFLLMGSDSFSTFNTWKKSDEILSFANLIVIQRKSSAPSPSYQDVQILRHGQLYFWDCNVPDISSTQCRQTNSLHLLTPPAVCEYIQKNHLYPKLS